MAEKPDRWEGRYQSKAENETSWFEDRPQVSLDLIAATGVTSDAAIVDIGAGSSRLDPMIAGPEGGPSSGMRRYEG